VVGWLGGLLVGLLACYATMTAARESWAVGEQERAQLPSFGKKAGGGDWVYVH